MSKPHRRKTCTSYQSNDCVGYTKGHGGCSWCDGFCPYYKPVYGQGHLVEGSPVWFENMKKTRPKVRVERSNSKPDPKIPWSKRLYEDITFRFK